MEAFEHFVSVALAPQRFVVSAGVKFGVRRRVGAGRTAADRTLNAIEEGPHTYPQHPFARTPGVRRILFLPPPTFPFAFAYMARPNGDPYVLATESSSAHRCTGRRGCVRFAGSAAFAPFRRSARNREQTATSSVERQTSGPAGICHG
jgi:hypothetical protein